MVDPKRVELGMYEGIPHLLTPVIVDPKKATNALRNAVLEMERRLRLLAEFGVRNIDQYNKKVRKLLERPRSLFPEDTTEETKPLPYILILIDELADLMMLEGRNVEESVTRLAQMARAVGMHLVLATQRPSVDVITGIIKANFPSRISFRVATRVDSRTVLDVMGAEHLLGKGDMLYLPPGSSRLTRVHGAFVTESEIIPGRAPERRRRSPVGRGRRRRAGSDVRRGCPPGAPDGQSVHLDAAAPSPSRLRPRRPHPRHDAARRHHRRPRRQQAPRSPEAPRLAAGSRSVEVVASSVR
jgi:DNA segregation ATPase FtsK/SpoIIIE-like protein